MLLLLALATAVAVAALVLSRSRARAVGRMLARESPLGVSTEGMKVCPSCGMGNMWTASTCSACAVRLKG